MAEKVGTIINGQTCLEKRGIVERDIELEKNLYSGVDYSSQYSSGHHNATSQEDSVKGKGRNGVGHLHSLPYTGTPRVNVNAIDPFNFNTISSKGATIGGKHDIDARKEAEVRSLFKREENEYSVTNENAISNGNVHGKGTGIELDTTEGGGGYDVAQRNVLIKKNLYNNIILSNNYSPIHQNAISSPNNPKGKSDGSGGHTYFQGYYGKPKENPNEIDYSNFSTFPSSTRSIGGKVDIEKRRELALTKRYYYDENSSNEYSIINQDAISDGNIIGKSTGNYLDTTNGGGGYDVEAREEHLLRNTWKKEDLEYTRPLVLAEYDIQTEFLVSSTDDLVEEKKAKAEKAQTEDTSKAKKVKAKKKKKDAEAEKPSPVPGVDKPNKPVERLDEVKSNRYYEMQGNVDTSYEGRA